MQVVDEGVELCDKFEINLFPMAFSNSEQL